MHFPDLNFPKFGIFDVLDILLVAFLIYQLYNLIRGTIAANIFIGFITIYLVYRIVDALHMQMLSGILSKFADVGIIAIIIVFQQEVRRFLLLVGKNASLQRNKAWWKYFFGKAEVEKNNYARIKPIIDACKSMKQTRTGALIVFAKYYDEQFYQNSCEVLDARISKRVLESIFQKNSPLHDGAVVISENKIKSASCILPVTEKSDLPAQFGLRHRAGIGVTEANDATAIIVSEETGEISYAKQGRIKMDISFAELEKLLNKDF
ncbi:MULTISPECIES: diadenylate cyclase CdaA [unclassified Mucilaginibacter]|uniref:diadenylate cyclase CdaA n=1 Tax=unclassified Mucilaginibacter TaxID=2617802 RepID=UPI000BAC76F6|nr:MULTISPECIES: diadenylate cyclase CdaA [unclassified Mucilaginibacter]PAW92041.1 TIGR00159 family protein [Mucilaginibacter sp. MD40]PLW89407.1 MAG: TIGR00159 family protein [Mucilaginibacter sp.]HEK19184.1 TIGR00159 family protein [Bacteroidota bacterium]